MPRTIRTPRPGLFLLAAFAALAVSDGVVRAQQPVVTMPAMTAAVSPPPALSLEECVQLAFQKQPALAAARASLAAAEDGRNALYNMPRLVQCLTREMPLRQQQAELGVTIARATLWQAEWETRYAVTRNYFSVIYVRTQRELLAKVLADVGKGQKRAKQLLDAGDPDVKVTKIDLDLFDINLALLRAREAEANVGEQKALAALREAIGISPGHGLEIVQSALPEPLAQLDRDALIQLALANRGEIAQASAAMQVTELEVAAQHRKHFGLKVGTFASAGDVHAQPVPQGVANGEYRPGGTGPEMPAMLLGKHEDRVARAADLSERARAVVDKTVNLVALETENGYLKWLEARDRLKHFKAALPHARDVEKRSYDRMSDGKIAGSEYIQAAKLQDEIQGQYNEVLYAHALSLAGLERMTAGGFRVYPPAPHR